MISHFLNNKNILILGSSGLIGNTISKYFFLNNLSLTLGVSLNTSDDIKKYLSRFGVVEIVDPIKTDFEKIISKINPSLIINCLGITKHLENKNNKENFYFINSIFPNLLSKLEYKLIHISTDCIFEKRNGENFIANDVYGYSKYLGEKNLNKAIIIRTSTIGHELKNQYGLLEWFLNNKNKVIKGYKNAFFNGVTTLNLSKFILNYNFDFNNGNKVINLISERISKFEILKLFNTIYNANKNINSSMYPKIDRSLGKNDNNEILHKIDISWDMQIREMKLFKEKNEFFKQ